MRWKYTRVPDVDIQPGDEVFVDTPYISEPYYMVVTRIIDKSGERAQRHFEGWDFREMKWRSASEMGCEPTGEKYAIQPIFDHWEELCRKRG